MFMTQYLILAASVLACLFSIITLLTILLRKSGSDGADQVRRMEAIRRDILDEQREMRQETARTIQSSVSSLSEMLTRAQGQNGELQSKRLSDLNTQLSLRQDTLQKSVSELMNSVSRRLSEFTVQNEVKLEGIKAAVESQLRHMQEDNNKKLEQMRATVDEKLEKTLSDRIGQSFKMVSERLEQVYRGLGEMQNLAAGVGDLKKVLSNVKTRGVLGEIQLGAILRQILSPEQFEANVATRPGSQNVVEFAVKLPGDGTGTVWLPIDAKFPADAYTSLCDAYDSGDAAAIAQATAVLERRIKLFAKDIHDKYIEPPHTTDFGVMFLPFEGLYAEVVRRGMLEGLMRDYKVTVAGPTTMAALLNSLQMGFRTLAIQKRSGEVWQVLGAVRTEFEKFGVVLRSAQQRLEQANSEIDQLVGVRTRQIQKKLKEVSMLPEEQSAGMFSEPADADAEE